MVWIPLAAGLLALHSCHLILAVVGLGLTRHEFRPSSLLASPYAAQHNDVSDKAVLRLDLELAFL